MVDLVLTTLALVACLQGVSSDHVASDPIPNVCQAEGRVTLEY